MYSFPIIKNKTYLSSNQEIDYEICALTNYCAVAFFYKILGKCFRMIPDGLKIFVFS